MAVKIKNIIILAVLLMVRTPTYAQTLADVAKNINKVKRDTMYIYAEVTMKDLQEAYNGARAILEMKIGEWVRQQHPNEGNEVAIVKAKDHFTQLETRRGDYYRAFIYVRKTDILPVADKSEVTVLEVAPPKETKVEPQYAFEYDKLEPPAITITSDEKEMQQVKSFYEIEPFVKNLKSQGMLTAYGKYATLPQTGQCQIFVYDKHGKIVALLRKTDDSQINLNTLKTDNVKNYKNCGAIWIQLK